jgi:hypothetical protein
LHIGSDPENSDSDSDNTSSDSQVSGGVEEVAITMPKRLKMWKIMERARNRANMRLFAPRATGLAPHLHAQRFSPLPFDENFDDYYNGPSLEDMRWLSRTQDGPFYTITNGIVQRTTRSPWELFKDYGFRLERSFALMFNRSMPEHTAEHMIPVSVDMMGPSTPRTPHWDTQVLSMSDMLRESYNLGCEISTKMFLKGMTAEGDYIHLDPELDSAPLLLDEVVCSIDIDSIVWVTHLIKVKTQIMVHVLPSPGKTAPISKNNHVFVELLMPQSEVDQFNDGSRTEWFTTRHSLSTIPHSHFAKVSSFHASDLPKCLFRLLLLLLFPRLGRDLEASTSMYFGLE